MFNKLKHKYFARSRLAASQTNAALTFETVFLFAMQAAEEKLSRAQYELQHQETLALLCVSWFLRLGKTH